MYSQVCGGARTVEKKRDSSSKVLREAQVGKVVAPGYANWTLENPCGREPKDHKREAMIWTSEIESAKSIAELKTAKTTRGSRIEKASGLKNIVNGDF